MEKTILSQGWKLKQLEPAQALDAGVLAEAAGGAAGGWLDVKAMPAMVHDVLLSHSLIETPWLPGRAEQYQWAPEKDWAYAVRFDVADPSGRRFLRFKGLDTIVDVYLNGERIAQYLNAFVPLRLDVTGQLKPENTLVLHFHTIFDLSTTPPKPLQVVDGDPARVVRRAHGNYGTYLGPHPGYSRVGVWDEVTIERADPAELTELVADAALSDNHSIGTVTVSAKGTSSAADTRLRARLVAPDGATVARIELPLSASDGAFAGEAKLSVENPQLWWPRGYGAHPVYTVECELVADGQVQQREARTVGFRRVTMPQPLHFSVNGVPVRLWGGNWVSPDWVTEVWNSEKARNFLDIAEVGNFNAFRVWGCVTPPNDEFYEECDRRGFMLWQDFTELPLRADDISREVCRRESAQLVKRLKHHPSIFIWDGANEQAQWHSWPYGGPGGEWPGRVAAEIDVRGVCQELDPARFYIPSSPYYGVDPNDPLEWDTHGYTNMWYVPGYDYMNFASEDTRCSAPPLHSVKRFFAPDHLWPADYSPIYKNGDQAIWPSTWMNYTTGASWKKDGPVEEFYDCTSPGDVVYRLGMANSAYYTDTINRQRFGRPAEEQSDRRCCGGYLVWKYNDSWPEIYSAKVDYFCEPYTSFYAIKRAYAPVLLAFEVGNFIWLWTVNDSTEPVEGIATIQLFHLETNMVRLEITRPVRVEPGKSLAVVRLDQAGISAFRREDVLFAALRDGAGKVIARASQVGDIERRVTFPEAKLDVQVEDGALVITTDQFARAVELTGDAGGDEFGWLFEDNWFDLLPGERKVVRILGKHAAGRVTAKPWYSPHATTVDWRR